MFEIISDSVFNKGQRKHRVTYEDGMSSRSHYNDAEGYRDYETKTHEREESIYINKNKSK